MWRDSAYSSLTTLINPVCERIVSHAKKLCVVRILKFNPRNMTIFVTSEAIHCRADSRASKIVIHANPYTISFLTHYLCSEHTNPLKQFSIDHPAIFAKDGLFWLSIVMSPLLIYDVARTQGVRIVTSNSSSVLAVEVWERMNNFIQHFTRHAITYSCWDLS